MIQRTRTLFTLIAGFSIAAFIPAALALPPEVSTPELVAEATQEAHNLKAWWGKEVVSADVEVVFGGQKKVDGTFIFEAHGPLARYDREDGVSVIYDGKTAWVTPASAEAPMGRFHVLTWPWFIMAPFKMKGEGIQLSGLQGAQVDGEHYLSLLQTFGSDMGDTPDDWYRFYINNKTMRIDAMSYIVTYGKDLETANKQPSIIKYLDYTDVGGPVIASSYEFWYWDPDTDSYVGDAPKGTGSVRNIRYRSHAEIDFSVPSNARELPLN